VAIDRDRRRVGNDHSTYNHRHGAIVKRYKVGFLGGVFIVVSAKDAKAALAIGESMLAPGELLVYVEEIE
jgi:hypothetical protein